MADPVALVLAGGGARGAYEAGALAELLPALPEAERPSILVGTSVGALNAAFLAANADRPIARVGADALERWRSVEWGRVLEPLVSLPEAARLAAYAGELLRVPRSRVDSLLDPKPLAGTLAEWVAFDAIERNVRSGALDCAAVVATAAATSASVVFHAGGPDPPPDGVRRIEYRAGPLSREHVLASAAIPSVFPAVEIDGEWYFDGGTRLNTPIKPALELGARRVIAVALSSLSPRSDAGRPDALDGAGQLVQALLVDPLVHDVQTLAGVNETLRGGEPSPGRALVPYILIAPPDPGEIGRIAADVYRRHYARSPGSLGLLGRLVDAGASALHGDLYSYVLFAPEFAEALIELGRRDARAWLAAEHDDGAWQLGRLG